MFNAEGGLQPYLQNSKSNARENENSEEPETKAQKWNIANIMSAYEEEIISQHQDQKESKNNGDQFSFKEENVSDEASIRKSEPYEELKHADPRQIIHLMNDPVYDGEEAFENQNKEDIKSNDDDKFQFKTNVESASELPSPTPVDEVSEYTNERMLAISGLQPSESNK
jgi:hypothetical protein